MLCQSQRPSRAEDKLMINLTATVLRHEYGAALNSCLANEHGMALTLCNEVSLKVSEWVYHAMSPATVRHPRNNIQVLKTSACTCVVADLHRLPPFCVKQTLCVMLRSPNDFFFMSWVIIHRFYPMPQLKYLTLRRSCNNSRFLNRTLHWQ